MSVLDDRPSTINGEGLGDVSLTRLLQFSDLSRYEYKLRNELRLRNAADLQYVDEQDLSSIGMSRPEQKRLRKEYEKMNAGGIVGKLKKVFGRSESGDRKESTATKIVEDENDQHVIPIERITLCKELGQGEFGSVWQASWKGGPSGSETLLVAVKCVAPAKLTASSSSFLQEAAIMTRMRHEHVVRLFGVVLDTKRVMMVSELATCGSLLECLHKPALRDSFPVAILCEYAEQIAKGMAYLESQRLIHRDLAARNVLVFSPKKVKISDFGLSRSLGIGEDYYRSKFSPLLKLPIAWCAPECINFLKFTSASDIWAYGVTLWEMFSYGEMPYHGLNGAQILERVDRKREHLPRPPCCPDDIYEMMTECWKHVSGERPTFAQLIATFPERMPQMVRTVCECRDSATDHLQFKNGELITVIDRKPIAYPDGYYWFGSSKNGSTGLFKPTDTVAHLGAEIPSSSKSVLGSSCIGVVHEKDEEKDKKKKNKKDKEGERERRKALISEPVGDVRHTCHVGIDGTAFGLLQLDKKEVVPTAASPANRRSLSSAQDIQINTSGASNRSIDLRSPVQMRMDQGREGVGIRETMSLRDVGNHRIAVGERDITSPSPLKSSNSLNRPGVQPSAPLLTASAASSMDRTTRVQFEPRTPGCLGSYDNSADQMMSVDVGDAHNVQQKPVAAVYARMARREGSSPASTVDSALLDEVAYLERDMTDFSVSTLGDFSDTRPLVDSQNTSNNHHIHLPALPPKSPTSSQMRLMTEDEVNRWQNKQEREHRKTDNALSDVRRKQMHAADQSISPTDAAGNAKSFSAGLLAKQTASITDWSPEAQEAYKLLVECGNNLQNTPSPAPSPSASRFSTMSNDDKRVTMIERSPPPRPKTPPHNSKDKEYLTCKNTTKQDVIESVTSYSPARRVHIIETKILDSPSNDKDEFQEKRVEPPGLPPKGSLERREPPGLPPKMRQIPVTPIDARMNYDNLNGIGAGRAVPPPVPPKPKHIEPSRVNGQLSPTSNPESPGCAPTIARSALLNGTKTEEVIKF